MPDGDELEPPEKRLRRSLQFDEAFTSGSPAESEVESQWRLDTASVATTPIDEDSYEEPLPFTPKELTAEVAAGSELEIPKNVDEVPTPEVVEPPTELEQPVEPEVPTESTEASEKLSKEEMKRKKHRENSQKWHQKWISKGVPREPKNPENVETPAEEPPADVEQHLPSIGSLSEARNVFVREWIATCGMPPSNDRRKAALKAWMECPLRARLLAGRQGTQMWVWYQFFRYGNKFDLGKR